MAFPVYTTYHDDGTHTTGCLFQRKAHNPYSHFDLKNGVGYKVKVGYRLMDNSYYSHSSSLVNNSFQPLYEAKSNIMEFFWWDIDGASALLSVGIAAITSILSF